jgi:hypothetical protein
MPLYNPLYKRFTIAYKGVTGSVRQASAKRTLRKIRKSSLSRYTDERSSGALVRNRQSNPVRPEQPKDP